MIKLFQYVVDLQRLRELQNFYYYLLEIRDVTSISWSPLTPVGGHSNNLLARNRPEADETT